jgi:hypothetical protein
MRFDRIEEVPGFIEFAPLEQVAHMRCPGWKCSLWSKNDERECEKCLVLLDLRHLRGGAKSTGAVSQICLRHHLSLPLGERSVEWRRSREN